MTIRKNKTMLNYIIRRLLYAVPIIIGVNVLTAVLFFYVNTPDDMARKILGDKNVTPEAIENWKVDHGYNLPPFINTDEGGVRTITQTIFYQKSVPLLWLDFGRSDRNNIDISGEISTRMWPSLAISLPIVHGRDSHKPLPRHAARVLQGDVHRHLGGRAGGRAHVGIGPLLHNRRSVHRSARF